MEFRNLGNSGLKVSLVGLGCNNFGMKISLEETRAVVSRSLDEGITLFDTADIYGNRGQSEEMLGKALGDRRKDVIVASKFGMAMGDGPYLKGASRRYICAAVEASLRRLGTDYIDLYQLHQPDPETPQEETLAALTDLVHAGKVRYIGSSNFAGWQVAEAACISRSEGLVPYVSAQNHYNLLERHVERELVPACKQFGVGILPYFPLASGLLTGKYARGEAIPQGTRLALMKRFADQLMTEKNLDAVDKLTAFAKAHGHSILDLAMSWLASNPQVSSVIAGATSPQQVTDNVKSGTWKLSAEEFAEVNKLTH